MLGATRRAWQSQIRNMPLFIVHFLHQITIQVMTAVKRQSLGETISPNNLNRGSLQLQYLQVG